MPIAPTDPIRYASPPRPTLPPSVLPRGSARGCGPGSLLCCPSPRRCSGPRSNRWPGAARHGARLRDRGHRPVGPLAHSRRLGSGRHCLTRQLSCPLDALHGVPPAARRRVFISERTRRSQGLLPPLPPPPPPPFPPPTAQRTNRSVHNPELAAPAPLFPCSRSSTVAPFNATRQNRHTVTCRLALRRQAPYYLGKKLITFSIFAPPFP